MREQQAWNGTSKQHYALAMLLVSDSLVNRPYQVFHDKYFLAVRLILFVKLAVRNCVFGDSGYSAQCKRGSGISVCAGSFAESN